jgi:hypothetical protein
MVLGAEIPMMRAEAEERRATAEMEVAMDKCILIFV